MTEGLLERDFEALICNWLVQRGGYVDAKFGATQGPNSDFDAEVGLDTVELFNFIGVTQGEAWLRLVKLHSDDQERTQRAFKARLAKEINRRGTTDVLRRGIRVLNVNFRLAYFKPAHGLTPELGERYDANRLTVTRQLAYETDSTKTLDLCLFVNGLPVATAELKTALTGQTIDDAIRQYRRDRDPKNVTLERRAVVHFAVDTERVAMTTKLAGASTRFLPFNKGDGLRAGNPPNPDGHRSAYLWEDIWSKAAWLDLFARFVHVETPSKGSRKAATVIFPRYHQRDAVLLLEDKARHEGPGHKYLVEHSAGSGKSNTIAWLSHRLSNLHDANDAKVFDKVIVITDRVVLDNQLQSTVYQFEHAHGVVELIDKDSSQLAAALTTERARIVITTLQKFPYVLDKVGSLPDRSYAVVIDEAHSSQTGEAAKELKRVLGNRPAEPADDEEVGDEPPDEVEAALIEAVTARGNQPNLSFFAFTATPKGKTLELFGTRNPATGRDDPTHLYSMKQAIEEGFILDVLASYTTYETFFHIAKAIEDDPRYDSAAGRAAIARFATLHPDNLAQKSEIVAEHFRRHVAGKVGGRAKAMVVTSSRRHVSMPCDSVASYATTSPTTATGSACSSRSAASSTSTVTTTPRPA